MSKSSNFYPIIWYYAFLLITIYSCTNIGDKKFEPENKISTISELNKSNLNSDGIKLKVYFDSIQNRQINDTSLIWYSHCFRDSLSIHNGTNSEINDRMINFCGKVQRGLYHRAIQDGNYTSHCFLNIDESSVSIYQFDYIDTFTFHLTYFEPKNYTRSQNYIITDNLKIEPYFNKAYMIANMVSVRDNTTKLANPEVPFSFLTCTRKNSNLLELIKLLQNPTKNQVDKFLKIDGALNLEIDLSQRINFKLVKTPRNRVFTPLTIY
jgi:hypothetical protein